MKDDRRPQCPFCAAPWTDAMLDAFDAMTDDSCGCCGHAMDAAPQVAGHRHAAPAPVADLCCESCGRAIYRALTTTAG